MVSDINTRSGKAAVSYIIRYNFASPGRDSRYSLAYRIFQNDFSDRWLQALQSEIDHGKALRQGTFYGARFVDELKLRTQMQHCIDVINSYSSISGWKLKGTTYPNMEHKHLMELHDEFEHLAEEPDFMSSRSPKEMKASLTRLNILIHRYECLYSKRDSFNIDIHFMNVSRWFFEEEDYNLFDPSMKKGYLYLDYGVTGVPVLNAYRQDVKQKPVPQHNFTAGAKLNFFPHDPFESFKDDLKKWLADRWQMDIDDPKLAIGYIPLGRLIGGFDSKEIGLRLERHTVIDSIDILDATTLRPVSVAYDSHRMERYPEKRAHRKPIPEAGWPSHPDIHHHLNFRPWITLPWRFSPRPLLEEAEALLEYFVPHRNYDVGENVKNGWKSLAIKGQNGVATNTYAHTHYGQKPNYLLTDMAEKCPRTIKMLNTITDIPKCQRIRWMLLEPGAKIAVHSDRQRDGDEVCLALNIALNMPEGCRFWIDTLKNGGHGRFTHSIPLEGGGGILLNNAKYHYVENNSPEARIHLIVHGPVRIADERLLKAARDQSGLADHKSLTNQLMVKKALQGEPLDIRSLAYQRWVAHGIYSPLFPDDVKILLLADDTGDEEIDHEALYHMTAASLFPAAYQIVDYSRLDEKLPLLYDQGIKVAVCIGAGTYARHCTKFLYTLLRTIHTMEKQGSPAAAHIIDHPDRSKGLPFFHEQFFILDIHYWNQLGRPKIGKPYTAEPMGFPKNYLRGKCLHDDYTPEFLSPGSSYEEESGTGGLGTAFMARALKNGFTIINIPRDLRGQKMFSYPRSGHCWQRDAVKLNILKYTKTMEKKVFVFNNESHHDPFFQSLPHFAPKTLYSVASGFKPYTLLRDIRQKNRRIPTVHFFDFSHNALDYQRGLQDIVDKDILITYLAESFSKYQLLGKDEDIKRLASESLRLLLDNNYGGKFEELLKVIQCTDASYSHTNILTDPGALIDKIDMKREFMLWVSNIWHNQVSLTYMNQEKLNDNFTRFVHALGKKANKSSWVAIKNGRHYGFLGESRDAPHGIITCGHGSIGDISFSRIWSPLGKPPLPEYHESHCRP